MDGNNKMKNTYWNSEPTIEDRSKVVKSAFLQVARMIRAQGRVIETFPEPSFILSCIGATKGEVLQFVKLLTEYEEEFKSLQRIKETKIDNF